MDSANGRICFDPKDLGGIGIDRVYLALITTLDHIMNDGVTDLARVAGCANNCRIGEPGPGRESMSF